MGLTYGRHKDKINAADKRVLETHTYARTHPNDDEAISAFLETVEDLAFHDRLKHVSETILIGALETAVKTAVHLHQKRGENVASQRTYQSFYDCLIPHVGFTKDFTRHVQGRVRKWAEHVDIQRIGSASFLKEAYRFDRIVDENNTLFDQVNAHRFYSEKNYVPLRIAEGNHYDADQDIVFLHAAANQAETLLMLGRLKTMQYNARQQIAFTINPKRQQKLHFYWEDHVLLTASRLAARGTSAASYNLYDDFLTTLFRQTPLGRKTLSPSAPSW